MGRRPKRKTTSATPRERSASRRVAGAARRSRKAKQAATDLTSQNKQSGRSFRGRIRSAIRWIRSLRPWVKAVLALIGAITTVVPLVLTFWPGLAPPPPCHGELRGVLSGVVVDRHVTYKTYLETIGGSTAGVNPDELNRVGKVISFDISVIGFKGKRLPIRWSTHFENGEVVPDERLKNQLALELQSDECHDGGRRAIWTPLPAETGTFFVRITLADRHGEELAAVDTPLFSVGAEHGAFR